MSSVKPLSDPFALNISAVQSKEYDRLALVLIRLFRSSFLDKMHQQSAFSQKFYDKMRGYIEAFEAIQMGLADNLPNSQILQKRAVKVLLSNKVAFSLADPQEKWESLQRFSYKTLSFPFQQTAIRKQRDSEQIHRLDQELIQGEEEMYSYLDNLTQLDPKKKTQLHRLLFVHFALYEKGHEISWLPLLANWANGNDRRERRINTLLKIFWKHPPLNQLRLPSPQEVCIIEASFQEYVVDRTLEALIINLDCFPARHAMQLLSEELKHISIRHDLLYLLENQKVLRAYSYPENRASDSLIRKLKLYDFYRSYCPRDARPLLLDLSLLTQSEDDPNLKRYLPWELSKLSNETFDAGWSAICESAERAVEEQEGNQLILLLGFWIQNSQFIGKLPSHLLKPLEIIKFFGKMANVRLERALNYFNRQIDDLEEFEEELAKLSVALSFDQKCFLFARFEEEDLLQWIDFLTMIGEAVDFQIDSDSVFHFLMSEIPTKRRKAEDPLIQLKALCERLKNEEEKVSLCMEISTTLSTLTTDLVQQEACFRLQELLTNHLGLDQS